VTKNRTKKSRQKAPAPKSDVGGSQRGSPPSASFAKAPLALLARQDLTPAEKLVAIVLEDLRAFSGRRPTQRALAEATGLGERTVRRILGRLKKAAKMAALKGEKKRPKWPPQPDNLAGPLTFKQTIQTKKRKKRPSPLPLTNSGTEKTAPGPQGLSASVAILAAKMAEGAGRQWGIGRVRAAVEDDLRHDRYNRAALEMYLAATGPIAAPPWKLADDIRAALEAKGGADFRERIRQIRIEGLTDVRRESDGRRWRVRYPDERAGLLILESVVEPPRRPTLADLEREREGWKFDRRAAGSRTLERRIAALRAGLPDPDPPRAPEPEKIEIRQPKDLAGWTFRPDHPTLFSLEGGRP